MENVVPSLRCILLPHCTFISHTPTFLSRLVASLLWEVSLSLFPSTFPCLVCSFFSRMVAQHQRRIHIVTITPRSRMTNLAVSGLSFSSPHCTSSACSVCQTCPTTLTSSPSPWRRSHSCRSSSSSRSASTRAQLKLHVRNQRTHRNEAPQK
jgi:hypothetical protein